MARKIFALIAFVVVTVLTYLTWLWLPQNSTENLFYSALAATILYAGLRFGLEELVAGRIKDAKTRYSFRKAIFLLLILGIAVVWLRIWVPNPQALLVAYGVIAAGLAVALQDVVKNLAGSLTIFLTGMFQVGNRIEIDGTHGDVIDVGLFNTTLLEIRGWMGADQATGRITTVPNGVVLRSPVQNFTKLHKYLWDELSVVITAESDWAEAMRLLGEIGHEHTAHFIEEADRSLTRLERYYYVEGHVLDPNVYISANDNGYQITLRYVVDAWQRRSTNSDIWGHLIRVFDEHDRIYVAPVSIATPEYPLPPQP